MNNFLPTIILRHRKENLKKCSLTGLERRSDLRFFTYPQDALPDLHSYLILAMDGPVLSEKDGGKGLFLIDATWNYSEKMLSWVFSTMRLEKRTLPAHFRTAYPRKQTACPDPLRGLASVEALYIAYHLLGRDTDGLLDSYYWKTSFLESNSLGELPIIKYPV